MFSSSVLFCVPLGSDYWVINNRCFVAASVLLSDFSKVMVLVCFKIINFSFFKLIENNNSKYYWG